MNREIAEALADALASVATAVGNNLVVESRLVITPAAPTIDIYPADPFQDGDATGFGGGRHIHWTVRARVHTIEHEGAQDVLLDLMESSGSTSVEDALIADQTLGGLVESLGVDGPSGFIQFIDQAGITQTLGVSWRVEILTREPS